jgi:hypothetical protein
MWRVYLNTVNIHECLAECRRSRKLVLYFQFTTLGLLYKLTRYEYNLFLKTNNVHILLYRGGSEFQFRAAENNTELRLSEVRANGINKSFRARVQ